MKYSEISKSKGIETLATIAFGFLVIGGVFYYNNDEFPLWTIYIAFGSLFCGLFIPFIAKQITWVWFKLAEGMGYVMSRVVLGSLFFLFITPFSFLFRIFNSDNLNIKKIKDSYYTDRDMEYSKSDLENPW